jgi:DedD protein
MNKGELNLMDRRLKERLIGATILVVLIVLIVPELLSGPKRSVKAPSAAAAAGPASGGATGASSAGALRTVTVDLATSRAATDDEGASMAAASPADALPADAAPAEPLPASAAPSPAPPAGTPTISTLKAQQPAEREVEKAAAPPNTSAQMPASGSGATAVPHHGWTVQIGSYVSRANAEKQVHRLKARNVYVSSSGKGSSLRFRVRQGPFSDRGTAEKAVSKLRKEGLSASLVPP